MRITDKYEDIYTATLEAVEAVKRGDATPDQQELAKAWDHASRFGAAAERYCHGLGESFLRMTGWIRE
jgi:hypothetical protein